MPLLRPAAIVALTVALTAAQAEPLVHRQASFYYIEGNSAVLLAEQIGKAGPEGADRKRHPTLTKWHVQWKFRPSLQGSVCKMEEVVVIVGLITMRPRWRGEAGRIETWYATFTDPRTGDGWTAVVLIAAVATVVLNAILIPYYGIDGAAATRQIECRIAGERERVDRAAALALVDRARALYAADRAAPVAYDGKEIGATISVGASVYPRDAQDAERMRDGGLAHREARTQLVALKEQVEKLSQPPASYGTFLEAFEDGTADVFTNGRKLRVHASPEVELSGLKRGQEVMLNEALNVINVHDYEVQGEVVTLKEILDEGKRVLVIARADEERVIELATRDPPYEWQASVGTLIAEQQLVPAGRTVYVDPHVKMMLVLRKDT